MYYANYAFRVNTLCEIGTTFESDYGQVLKILSAPLFAIPLQFLTFPKHNLHSISIERICYVELLDHFSKHIYKNKNILCILFMF